MTVTKGMDLLSKGENHKVVDEPLRNVVPNLFST